MNKPQDIAQRQQVLDVSQSFIVQAPAGSGKTSLLTLRFLHLLTIVNNPEEILAITFTKKAAAEMHQRIIESIKLATMACPDNEFEAQTWTLATQVLQRDTDCEWHLLQNPNRLRVQTIDSLCARLTKQMPITARFGSPPSIQQDARDLYTEAARNCLSELDSDDAVGEAIRLLLAHVDNQLTRAEGLISTMLASRDQWLRYMLSRESNLTDREVLEGVLMRTVESILEDIADGFTQGDIELLGELLQFAGPNIEDKNSAISRLASELNLADTSAGSLPHWLALGDFLLTGSDSWRKTINKKMGFPAENAGENSDEKAIFKERKRQYVELLQSFQDNDELTEAISWLRCLPNPAYSDQQWQIIQALLLVLPQAVAHLRLVFQQRGCVDFCEVCLSASHALQDATGMTDVGLKLDYQLQHLLVDEFQDTSETQFMLLKDLVAGWQVDDGRTLFLVGDPMQSIYRFRQAEVGLFLKTQQDGLGEVRDITPMNIAVNFRSQHAIVHWVNKAFSQVMPLTDNLFSGAISYKPSVPFRTESSAAEAVTYYPYENRVDEGSGLLALIQQIKQQTPDETIGVLVRGRKSLTELVIALNEAGVPYQATDIDPLNMRQTVIDLMSLTRAYLHPADRIAWLSVLRAPWCAVSLDDMHSLLDGFPGENVSDLLHNSDSVQALSEQGQAAIGHVMQAFGVALRHRDRVSVTDSIRGLWQQLLGPECLSSPSDLADCERFFDCLTALESERESIDLTVLQEQVEKLYAAPDVSASNALQIMTVHKAKGLEFDHVILPGLDRKAGNDEKRLLAWLERPADVPGESELMIAPIKETGADKDDAIAKYLNRVEQDKARHESQRLLYVAATRAKKHLHLSFCLKVDEKANQEMSPKTPATNTLLGLLWPTIKDDVIVNFSSNKLDNKGAVTTCYIKKLNIKDVEKIDYSNLDYQHQVTTNIQPQTNLIEFDWATDLAASVGTVCHQWMQILGERGELSFTNSASEQQAIRHQLLEVGVLPRNIDKASERVEQILLHCVKDNRGQWVLNNQHEDSQFELALSGVIDDAVIHCRLDRTFVDEETRWIIDYKTSRHDDDNKEEFLDAEMTRYKPQLEQYARLMS
ncbi:MAG: UvrD-helicase domain-containing protein, partial [Cycloclasticus sp.]